MLEYNEWLEPSQGMDAVKLKINYFAGVERGELPYSSYGLPVEYFSLDKTQIPAYLEQRFREHGIEALSSITEEGRITVVSTDVLVWEGKV